MKKLFLLIVLVVYSFNVEAKDFFCESKKNGNVYKAPYGCFNNITLTEEEFLSKSDKLIEYTPGKIFYCEKKGSGEQYLGWDGTLQTAYWDIYINSTGCDSSSLSITKDQFTKKNDENLTRGMESMKNKPEIHHCDLFPKSDFCNKPNSTIIIGSNNNSQIINSNNNSQDNSQSNNFQNQNGQNPQQTNNNWSNWGNNNSNSSFWPKQVPVSRHLIDSWGGQGILNKRFSTPNGPIIYVPR